MSRHPGPSPADRRRRRAGAAALVATLVAPAAGCGGIVEPPRPAEKCAWMSEVTAPAGHTAIVVDVSNSTRAGGADAAPDYAKAVAASLKEAVERRDRVSVGAFGGSGTDLNWIASDLSTDWKWENDNPDNQRDRQTEARECLTERVAAAQASAPATPQSDILRALATTAQLLNRTDGARHLVLATDGLVTTGCANLVPARFAGEAEISAIARVCAGAAKEITPTELSGIEVLLLGIGNPAASQPVPSPAQLAWLTDLWQRLCDDAGGKGRCTVSNAPVTGTAGYAGAAPSPHLPDPVVPYGDNRIHYTVPTLFDTGRWVIRPAALPVLTELAVGLRTGAPTRVEVNGYADQRGGTEENRVLSQRRAEAVRDVLLGNGVPRVEAHGRGETVSCPEPPAAGAGVDALQCARRVDIIVTRG